MGPVHDRESAVGASRLTVFHELALEKCGDYTILCLNGSIRSGMEIRIG